MISCWVRVRRRRLYGSTLVPGSPVTDTFTLRHPFIPFEYDKMVMEADSVFLLKVWHDTCLFCMLQGWGEPRTQVLCLAVHDIPVVPVVDGIPMVAVAGAASTPVMGCMPGHAFNAVYTIELVRRRHKVPYDLVPHLFPAPGAVLGPGVQGPDGQDQPAGGWMAYITCAAAWRPSNAARPARRTPL